MQLYHPRTSVKSFRGVFFGFCERNRMTDLSALHEATPQRIINVYKRSVFIIFFFFLVAYQTLYYSYWSSYKDA